MNRDIQALISEALMCSVFADPNDPGLSYDEILEIARRFNYRDGEIGDAARQVLNNHQGKNRYVPSPHAFMMMELGMGEDPELINYDAIDYVFSELNERIRTVGIVDAKVDRSVILERAVSSGIDRFDVEAAITAFILSNCLKNNNGILSFTYGSGVRDLPGTKRRGSYSSSSTKRPLRNQVLPVVRDVVSRRIDGRQSQADPLNAFSEALEGIGFANFRMWWMQTVNELKSSDPNIAPVSCTTLSAALVEGALTFAAKHSRDNKLGAFQSSNFDSEPKNWKAEKLIESAAQGAASAILTPQLRSRAEHLNKTRQRVHAGRMLVDHPQGPPDLRPEEGRDAKAIAEHVTRAVIDWLDKA